MFKRDYSNFSKENFIDDVKVQRFGNAKFEDFYTQLNDCVNRHVPLKKMYPKEIK